MAERDTEAAEKNVCEKDKAKYRPNFVVVADFICCVYGMNAAAASIMISYRDKTVIIL